jgi:hypothetical protein
MEPERAIDILEKKYTAIEKLYTLRGSPEFTKWKWETEGVITQVFGEKTPYLQDFLKVQYFLNYSAADFAYRRVYERGLDKAKSILALMINEVREQQLAVIRKTLPQSFGWLEKMCSRFHIVARQLRDRYAERETLEIEDENDAIDLFYALLKLNFDEIELQEWKPRYAKGPRIYFLIKPDNIFLGVKKTKQGLKDAELGAQVLVDVAEYQSKSNCKLMMFFIYDPEGRIGNPTGFERELERIPTKVPIRAIINPKGDSA